MRAVVQGVSRARVTVEGTVAGEMAVGLMILLGIGRNDTSAVAVSLDEKIANLMIFEDSQGKMNRSLLDAGGSALVVSQFTLYGDARGQRRPRSEEHTSELQSHSDLVCRLLLEKKKKNKRSTK